MSVDRGGQLNHLTKSSVTSSEKQQSPAYRAIEKAAVGALDLIAPGLGTLADIGWDFFKRGAAEAEEEAARVLGELEERVRLQSAEIADLQSSVALLSRLVNEAGRHPEREMRRALGGLGARLAFSDKILSRKFVIAEVAAKLTALDVELLTLLSNGETESAVACPGGEVVRGSESRIVVGYLWTGLNDAGYALAPREVDQLLTRLASLQLVAERVDTARVLQHQEYPSTDPTSVAVRTPVGVFETTELGRDVLQALAPRGLGQPPLAEWDAEGHFKASTVVLDGTGRTIREVEAAGRRESADQ